MNKMMAGMDVKPTGDIDKDFVTMMSHTIRARSNGRAIALRQNERLRRLAQEIIVDQTQEIAAMKLAIGEPAAVFRPRTNAEPAPMTRLAHKFDTKSPSIK